MGNQTNFLRVWLRMSREFCYEQHLWDGMKQVTDRFDEGKRTVNQMQKFLDSRASIESEACKKLSSLVAKPARAGIEARTLGAGWESLKFNVEEQSKSRNNLATILKDLSTDLAQFKRDITRQKDQHLSTVKNLNTDLEKGRAAVKKAKTTYHQKTESAETALISYEAAQQNPQVTPNKLQKLSTTANKLKKDAENADHTYQNQLQEFQTFQIKFEENMKEILKDFQMIEERRVTKLKEVMDTVCATQDTMFKDFVSQQDSLVKSVSNVNGIDDVQQFISEAKTGLKPPKPTEYEPYKGKHEQFKRTTIPQNLIPQTKSEPAQSTSQPKVATAKASEPTRSVAAPAAAKHAKAKALFEYKAADATELSFSVGEIITVTKQDASGWWEGENHGKHGMFPGNYVELVEGGGETRKRCKVNFEFIAQSGDELTIKVGDIVYIDVETEGWYSGTNERGEQGLFPANYVEIV